MIHFDGPVYDPEIDHARLTTQLDAVRKLMSDGQWRTFDDIAFMVAGSTTSLSARLRDLRKPKFGGYTIERRRVARESGLFEYRMVVNR